MRIPVVITLGASLLGAVLFVSSPLERTPDPMAPGARVADRSHGASSGQGGATVPPAGERTVQQEAVRRFELGFAGGVLINEGTRRTLEMAASTMSNPPREEELARLQAALAAGLPGEEVARVMSLARGYTRYAAELEREVPVGAEPRSLAEYDTMAARIDGIRRRHFEADTAAALFGPHDAHARLVLEASLVETDRGLTGEQKLARLAELRAQLPADQQHLISAPAPATGQAS